VEVHDFTTIVLSAGEWAVFDVFVAKGYDSGNAEMDKWLEDNAAQYKQLEANGIQYVVECYNDEKFKGGDKPDSVVEIWLPIIKLKW
jgi:predicted transcriptional regulator YdeE